MTRISTTAYQQYDDPCPDFGDPALFLEEIILGPEPEIDAESSDE